MTGTAHNAMPGKAPSGRSRGNAAPQSLDVVRAFFARFPGPDARAEEAARARDAILTKPPGALGRLEDIVFWLTRWQGRYPPRTDQAATVVFVANHGVTAQNISAFPPEVTGQMAANFRQGGAAVNQLCKSAGLALEICDLSAQGPSADMTQAPALSVTQCLESIRRGMAMVSPHYDLLCIGEMGIGNTTVAAAIAHALYGGRAKDWCGPGAGLNAQGVARKAEVVARAVSRHRDRMNDALDVLRHVGGSDMAAMFGAIVAARLNRVPVILDGYVATAAAAVAAAMRPDALDHCQAGHVSAEPAHAKLLTRLGLRPMLDLGMRLGEASGAVLAAGLVKAACAAHNGMASFAEAGVNDGQGKASCISANSGARPTRAV